MMIKNMDSLEYISELKEYSQDIMFCDPPYALGSEVIVRPDGKVDYKKAVDFMSKWDMPTGEYWEQWFKEAFRTLKHGGHLVMYGMDRQLLLFKYYGHLAGFTEKQSMYWYFISNFPKASDLSKNIDKNNGVEFERGIPISENIAMSGANYTRPEKTAPSTELAKKYDGYKYSIAPLKQTNETIMVFQKPYKTGSCLHDTLAFEQGDDTCTCGALDIGGNKVGTGTGEVKTVIYPNIKGDNYNQGKRNYEDSGTVEYQITDDGRYPAQTFCDDGAGEVLGDVSKVLHKCTFEEGEHDLYIYQPKVSKAERNAGCENNHPTLKPIDLNYKVLKLFKTPNEQTICFPFAGAGSEIIGGIKAGFKNWNACEISEEYIEIAEARIKHWEGK